MKPNTDPNQGSDKLWIKLAMAGLVLSVAGGLYFFIGSRKKHQDLQLVKQLRKKIFQSFENAEESLMPLVPEKQKTIKDDKISINLNLAKNLAHKDRVAVLSPKNPFEPPFQKGLLISELPPEHRLLYNKFYFYRNHLLVVTKKFQFQAQHLTASDFKQATLAMFAINGCFFYNCGPHSGFSQKHKHIQIFPENALSLPIMEQLIKIVSGADHSLLGNINYKGHQIKLFQGYQFIHGLMIIDTFPCLSVMGDRFHKAFQILHQHLSENLKNKDFSFNLIGHEKFLLMIPRKEEMLLKKVGINSVGFMGSILLKDEELYEQLQYLIKPTDILRQLTFTEFP